MTRSVPEWIGAHPDAAIPPRVKLRIFERDGGHCKECTRKVGIGLLPAYDHVIALVNGGEHRETNLQLLCTPCHAIKTALDVAEKSVVRRKRMKAVGIKSKKSRPMPGSRASGWKKKLDGSVERR